MGSSRKGTASTNHGWILRGALIMIFIITEIDKAKAHLRNDNGISLKKRDTNSLTDENSSEQRSLAFIFDVTGSMHDDWKGAITGGKLILNEFLTYKKRPVSNFILVPFRDPEVGPTTKTENSDIFLEELNKLSIHGGGDCREMSISGVKEALETAYPFSYLYVFTDASAKDYNRLEEVLKLIQRKHSQVVFFITGDCDEAHSEAFLVYEKIAAASYGQIYYLLKKNVDDVLKSVLITTKPNKSNLLVVSSPELDPTNSVRYNLSVESNLTEMIIEVAGASPEVDIRNPLGNPPDKINIPFDLPNNKFIVIEYPEPAGNWVLKVTFHPEIKQPIPIDTPLITVKGIGSAYEIKHGFSIIPPSSLSDTAYRPLEKTENYLYMEVHPTEDTLENKEKLSKYKWDSVDVMKNNGKPYMTLPLQYILPGTGEEILPMRYLAGPFTPPDDLFNLAFQGFDENNNHVTRLTSNYISSEEASAPYVKMASSKEFVVGEDLKIICEVESLIEFSLQWYKDGKPFGGKKDFMQSSDASLILPHAKKEDEGQYKCEATNIRGSDSQATDITGIVPPKIDGMNEVQISVVEGASIVLNCNPISDLEYEVKWIHKHNGIEEEISLIGSSNIKRLENNSLSVSILKSNDAGMYVCRVSNRAGVAAKEVEIVMISLPKIEISKENIFMFTKGEKISINCNVVTNAKTKVHWEFNDAEVDESKEILTNDTIPLIVPSADQAWEGKYTCVAENEAGKVRQQVEGIYVVLPSAKALTRYVTVKQGQDATLTCLVTGIPPPVISWAFGDQLLENGVKHQISFDGSSLQILNSNIDDEGTYKCMANGPQNSESVAEIKLHIGKPPKSKQQFLNVSLELKEDGIFPCAAESDSESGSFPGTEAEISWKRQDGPLNLRRYKIHKSGDLVINNAEVSDKGVYICTLRNAFGETQMILNLDVKGIIPTIKADYPEKVTINRGETVVLWCNATGTPQPRLIWSYSPDKISEPEILEDGYEEKGSISVKEGKLTLYNAISNYQGIYSCRAESEAGISPTSKEYILQIKGAPVLIDDGRPTNITVSEGDTYTLHCSSSSTEKVSYKWFKDDRYVINSNIPGYFTFNGDHSSLTLHSTIPGYHNGTYKCTASNEVGADSKKFIIFVENARARNEVI